MYFIVLTINLKNNSKKVIISCIFLDICYNKVNAYNILKNKANIKSRVTNPRFFQNFCSLLLINHINGAYKVKLKKLFRR